MNKERVYNYFGGKTELFARVLSDQLATAASDVPLDSSSLDDIAEHAGRLYDYHRQHPALARLLQWEALAFPAEVPDEQSRTDYYRRRTTALADGQSAGTLTATLAPDVLHFVLLSLGGYWANLPQVARMITGASADDPGEDARRRACVVEAARRLVSVAGPSAPATAPATLMTTSEAVRS